MAGTTHYHAGRLHKATPGEAPVSLLTYPAEDDDGDLVRPDGGAWVGRPLVDLEHGIRVGTGRVECLDRRVHVARPIVENRDGGACHLELALGGGHHRVHQIRHG